MGLFKPSVKSLVGRGDVRGLINKLDQKDMGEACIGLQVLRERAVPALIELLGTPQEATACMVLVNIGAPALPALAEVIRSGRDNRLDAASVAIIQIRQKGVRLPDNIIATLEAVKTGGSEVDIGRRAMATSALGESDMQSLERLIQADLATREASCPPTAPQEDLEDHGIPAILAPPTTSASTPHPQPDLPGEPRILEGHTNTVEDCAVSPDGCFIVSASDDCTLRVWDASTGQPLRILEGHTGCVWACAFSPDGCFIVSASVDRTPRVWDAATGQLLHTLEGHTQFVMACAFSPDGRFIVSASEDHTLRVWDASTGQTLHILEGHTRPVDACAFSPDGRFIVSASWDNTLRVWDATTGQTLRTLEGHTDSVWACAFSPDGCCVVSASEDCTLRVWDASTGQTLRILEGHTGKVGDCAFSPDGRFIVSASYDRTLRVWAATGQLLHTLEGHTDFVQDCAFSPDGCFIVSASEDHTLRVWDASTGQPLRILEGHTGAVWACAFSPDGRIIVSASSDKMLRVWDATTGQTLPESIVAALVAIKTGGAEVDISRQMAAANAFGPLDTQSLTVQAYVDRYTGLIIDPHIFFRPTIPPNKLSSALEKFAPSVRPDEVLVLVDDTLRTSGKSGVLLTDTHLYGKLGKLVPNRPMSIPLTAIVSVSLEEKRFGNELFVNGATFQDFSGAKKENLRLFTRMLREIVALRSAAALQAAAAGATPYPAGCVNCGVQRDGQDVRIHYGNKKSKSSQSYGTGKNAMVITTTSYTVGGSDDVSICDHCTKVRSLWRFFNVLWSVPLGLGCAWIFVSFVIELFSGGIHGGFNSFYVVFLFFCGLFGIIETVDYVKCLVKPLNEHSRSAVARQVVAERHKGKYDTFWTQAELKELKLS